MTKPHRSPLVSAVLIANLLMLPLAQVIRAEEGRPYIPLQEGGIAVVSFTSGALSTRAGQQAYVIHYLLNRSPGAVRTGLSQLKGDVFEAVWQYRNNVQWGTPEYVPTRSTTSAQNDMVTFRKGGAFGPGVQLKSGSTDYIVKEMLNKDTLAERFVVPDDQYDSILGVLKGKAARGEISQQRLARELGRLEKGGFTNDELRSQTRRAIHDLRLIKGMGWSPLLGVREASLAGAIALPLLAGFDILAQLCATGEVDWGEAAAFGGIGAGGTFMGTWAGAQTQWLLMTTPMRDLMGAALGSRLVLTLARLGGFAAATLIASAIVNYALYFCGYISLREANRGMIATGVGVGAGVLITATAWVFVAAFGTASTGTPIVTLSGAAAYNATLAWFGGGAVAAGGGGMTAGAIVLTAGAAVIVIGVTFAVLAYYKWKDAKENQDRITFLLDEAAKKYPVATVAVP